MDFSGGTKPNFMTENLSGVLTSTEQTRYERDGLFIRQNDYHKKYLYTEILWVEASRSYSYLYLKDGTKIIVAHPLVMVGRKLPCHHFARVHRRYILNLNYINAFIGNSARIGEQLFPVSDHYQRELLELFDFLDVMSGKLDSKNEEEEV